MQITSPPFWLMMVSRMTAVLPVWRSPMISSRWPRPMGVIASMALIPVCSGSCTFLRCTTLGAWISSSRSWVSAISPRPSIGLPSGSTTRPRKLSPTGTDSTSPVRRTCWPSSILLNSPRMTTPISRTSRFSARPRVPSGNSSSSFAMAEGSPSTRAMPSPLSMTVPTSSLDGASGLYSSTKRASASRISSGRIVSSVIFLMSLVFYCDHVSARQLAAHGCQAAGHARVDELVTDLDRHATHDTAIQHNVQKYVMPVEVGQRRRQPVLLLLAERGRHPDHGDQALPAAGRGLGVGVQVRLQATSPRFEGRLGDQPFGFGANLAVQQGAEQPTLAFGGQVGVGQGGVELRLGHRHPAEPEQFVFQVVQVPGLLGGDHHG